MHIPSPAQRSRLFFTVRARFHKELARPKIKTRRSAAKRFSVTGSGKFRRRRQNLRHILTKKDSKRRSRLGKGTLVDSANMKSVKRLLPYA